MHGPLHHLDLRKRFHIKKQPYPDPNKFKRLIDRSILFIGIFVQLTVIPQILNIWLYKNAAGVSVISWAGFLLYSILFLIYAIVHRVRYMIIIYIFWIFIHSSIVVGTLLYG